MKNPMRALLENYRSLLDDIRKLIRLNQSIVQVDRQMNELAIDKYLQKNLYENPHYQDSKRLNQYEFKVYSQGGEDGIIAEIFQRIETTNQWFVEFGVGNGLENNTTYLLTRGWKGGWIEGNSQFVKQIKREFSHLLNLGKLQLKNTFVSVDNIEKLFAEFDIPQEFDFLSIDIDGNDYWIWQAIANYRPRVVAIEYNAIYPPESSWVMKYNPKHQWDYSSYMGASLLALEKLATTKGYKLVGCSFTGVNAFFVRSDLVKDKFCEPYTTENHYQPARYFLCDRTCGHPRSFGDFETI